MAYSLGTLPGAMVLYLLNIWRVAGKVQVCFRAIVIHLLTDSWYPENPTKTLPMSWRMTNLELL